MRRASILVLALWTLCLLTTFVVYLGAGIRQKITLVERLSRRDALHYAAEAGVRQAILELSNDNASEPDSFRKPWSNNAGAFKDIALGIARCSVTHDYVELLKDIKGTMNGLVDEESKINLNTADLQTLTLLFENLCLDKLNAQTLAACIIDWRDKDSLLTTPDSAESSFYEGLPEPYKAKDSAFEVLEEALLVKGITQELFDKMKDYVTIYGTGRININTASARVLYCLGISREVVDKIIAFRYGKDATLGTADDNIFAGPETVTAQLSQYTPLSDAEVSELSNPAASGAITTFSNYFMIKSVASIGNGSVGSSQTIVCVVTRAGKVLSHVEF